MSQSDFGTIDPNTKSGPALATDLNNWRDALHSSHKGATAPSYAAAGTLWLDDTSNPSWSLKLYDGTDWIALGTFNTTTNTFSAGAAGTAGKHTLWVPAGSMISRATAGPASGLTETATNKVMRRTFDFDAATIEYVQFGLAFPKRWDEGTVAYLPFWTAASGSGDVVWSMQAVAIGDDDALDASFGTAVEVTDTLLLADDQHVGPESAAITVAGTPAEGDEAIFQLFRNATDAGDTLAVDARLLGVKIIYTTDAENDD